MWGERQNLLHKSNLWLHVCCDVGTQAAHLPAYVVSHNPAALPAPGTTFAVGGVLGRGTIMR
jgi:hypothetical protein